MPFGLTNVPAVFQSFVNEILREYLNDFAFVNLDDILIFSPDPATHQHHVRQVLTRLLVHQLYVKAEKCEFHASSVSFLGFIILPGQVKMDPEKWGPEAEEAFHRLKELFTTAPVLTMPEPHLQFIVEVDASSEGVGAVLSQRSPKDNRILPCAFLSRKLSPAEQNYDVGNRELLAIKEGTVCEGKSAILPGAEKWLELLAQSVPSTKAWSNGAPMQSGLAIS
ncbi:hypothetical protein L3Q82_003446 [Scortum barcoo]|uniref:Uncharacterized protein n=1 Tax=Scortum barcoo TaxID=214431 RepID=A0ACB8VMM9_9TELE|nr:hypothetical protein L3Q82_003446 [Scortum barcoo]